MSVEAFSTLLVAALSLLLLSKARSNRYRNPPGPKGLPLIGNMLDYPPERQWFAFTNWKREYGDIIHLSVLGTSTIILNSKSVCVDLLDKRSKKYSGRAQSVVLMEFLGFDYSMPSMDYSPRWRRYRRLFHQHFNEHAVLAYRPVQERSINHFLQLLLAKPENFLDHTRLLFGETVLDVVYGIKVEDKNNIFLQAAEKAIEAALQVTIPGRFLVEFFPAMKYLPSWFPGGTFKKYAAERRHAVLDAKELPFDYVTERMRAGTAEPSVLSSMLDVCNREAGKSSDDVKEAPEDIAKACAAVAYMGGADTSGSTIQALFMAMANHPDVQRAAWMELDALLGPSPNRLPTQGDEAQLPFITAITKELLRWHNVAPLGVPRVATEDDEYNGYTIRKGTIIMANIWGILHDPEVYPEPRSFNPWRWLINGPDGPKLNLAVPDPDAVWGFGRRICPGRHFASNSLFSIVATVLTCFELKPTDALGQPIDRIQEGFSDGFIVYPLPFRVSITPRSTHFAQLVRDLTV